MTDYQKLQREFQDVSAFLIALGDEKRQAIILSLLENVKTQGLQVTDLTEATQLSRPAVSHHLKILKEAKLVDYHKNGTKNFYYLTHETAEIEKLQSLLNKVNQIMKEHPQS